MPRKKANIDFEKSLHELETLVEKLEQGDLPLEAALQQFERGIALTRTCQQALKDAEQKVKILSTKNAKESLQDMDDDYDSVTHD